MTQEPPLAPAAASFNSGSQRVKLGFAKGSTEQIIFGLERAKKSWSHCSLVETVSLLPPSDVDSLTSLKQDTGRS